jgi:hypothetical protein
MADSDISAVSTEAQRREGAGLPRPPKRWRLLVLGGGATTLVRESPGVEPVARGRRTVSELRPDAPAP